MKIILLTAAVCMICISVHAQSIYNSHYYSSRELFGPNGYRTVAEEDALMEQVIAEHRKIAMEEYALLTPEEREKEREAQIVAAKERLAAEKNDKMRVSYE